MSTPNIALRSVRASLRLSQEEMAQAIQNAGLRSGEPNGCTKRLVQRWEAGEVLRPRAVYVRALEMVTGQPAENLGFDAADEHYGLDRTQALDTKGPWIPVPDPKAPRGPLTGIWLSRYEYHSSSRDGNFTGQHHALIIQHGARLQVRSLPESAGSRMMMDLTANGQVLTGTWTERTDPAGYYHGAVYHGAIQMLIEPTGRKMSGKWVGFGHDFELNTGPWTLELITPDTGKETVTRYSAIP